MKKLKTRFSKLILTIAFVLISAIAGSAFTPERATAFDCNYQWCDMWWENGDLYIGCAPTHLPYLCERLGCRSLACFPE